MSGTAWLAETMPLQLSGSAVARLVTRSVSDRVGYHVTRPVLLGATAPALAWLSDPGRAHLSSTLVNT